MQQDGETGSGSNDTILKKPVLAVLAATGLLVILAAFGMGQTTIAPNYINSSGGDLAEVGSLDGGGNSISINDNIGLNRNNVTGVNVVEADQFTTVHNTSLKAIDEAIDKYDYVKLRPTTYTGDTTITINTTYRDTVTLDATGATINYTGSGAAIQSKAKNDVENNKDRGRPVLHISDMVGPDNSDPEYLGSRGVKFVDVSNGYIDIKNIDGFEYQVYLRNEDRWSEVNEIDIHNSAGGKRVVQLDGTSVTGGSGTDSFRGTDIELRNADSYWSNDSYLIHQNGFLTASKINVEGFAQKGGAGSTIGWFINHSIKGSHIERFNLEGSGHAIEFGSNANPGEGLWMNSHMQTLTGEKFINADNKDLTFIRDGSMETGAQNPVTFVRVGDPDQDEAVLRAKNGTLQVNHGTKGSFKDFFELGDYDGTRRFTIQNGNNIRFNTANDQNFVFRHGGTDQNVMTIDDDGIYMNNGPIDMNKHNITRTRYIMSGGNVDEGGNQYVLRPDGTSADAQSGATLASHRSLNLMFEGGNNNENFRYFTIWEDAKNVGDPTATKAFEIEDDGPASIHNRNLDLQGNNVTGISYTDYQKKSGDLKPCTGDTEGMTGYNGTHWGCDGTSWNKMY